MKKALFVAVLLSLAWWVGSAFPEDAVRALRADSVSEGGAVSVRSTVELAAASERVEALTQHAPFEPEPSRAPGPTTPPEVTTNPELLAAEEEAYKWLFETSDGVALRMEREMLETEYLARSEPIFDEQFSAGAGTLIENTPQAWGAAVGDSGYEMEAYRGVDDASSLFMTLAPTEHPELFELRKQILWINELIVDHRRR